MKRNKFLMQEEENLKTSLPMGFVQLHLLSKQNYLAPSVEIYSYLAESGYAASVTPDPEGLGNGWNSGGGDLGGSYWSSTYNNSAYAYNLGFFSTSLDPSSGWNRYNGCSVRLVKDVK